MVSASAALQTVRANPVHSLLSTLGIIIGVAALVAILALAEGMEDFGREQIAATTDLQSITVAALETERMDGILVRRRHVPELTLDHARSLRRLLQGSAAAALVEITGREVRLAGDTSGSGAFVYATEPSIIDVSEAGLAAGRELTDNDVRDGRRVAIITDSLARHLAPGAEPASLIGRSIMVGEASVEVVGLVRQNGVKRSAAFVPLTMDPERAKPPVLVIRAHSVENVPQIRETITRWLDEHVDGGSAAFQIATNEFRVEQVRRGVLLFKIVMGIITGISVLVGGIGVMNVLLVSITERTKEIGIRRSSGARRSDIVMQFITESTALSLTGCFLGLLLGLASVFLFVPVIRYATDVPFQAAFDWSTVAIVAIAGLLVGLTFGTYPAFRAARLVPMDALRRE